jgi:hypothetical protein
MGMISAVKNGTPLRLGVKLTKNPYRSKSMTDFTGLKVSGGSSINIEFHSAIPPFHNPGHSKIVMG